MNRFNTLAYFALMLAGLFFLATQGVFAEDNVTSQDGGSDYQLSLFGSENSLMLPEFKSDDLMLAQNTSGQEVLGGEASAPAKSSGDDLAVAATNPIANLMQFQFQNTSSIESYNSSGYANSFVIQPVIPFKFTDDPDAFFKFGVTRTTLPILTTPNIDGVGQYTGLGDLVTFGFAIHEQKIGPFGGMWGVGPALTIPTATSHKTGEGKFQMGPGAVLFMKLNKKVQTGVLAYQQWDITGDSDRNYVNKSFFQPILNYHFDSLFGQEGWYASLQDILWSYDWRAKQLDLPIGFRLGRVFKAGNMPLNVFVEPFGRPVFEGGAGGKYGVKLNVTFLFPS
ncbi:MAG: hypothetical protein KAJ63_01580 [Methyloprofundus sp.]|nr:hypothetical protein [Methyloprofundus sp.]